MAYATLAQFRLHVGTRTSATNPGLYEQMTDRLSATTASDTLGQMLLDDAEAEVNGYLARRYAVPVEVSGDAVAAAYLKRCVVVIATWCGWRDHPKVSANRESSKSAYDAVIKELVAIANGSMELPASTTPAGTTTSSATGEAIGNTRVFTEDAMKGI